MAWLPRLLDTEPTRSPVPLAEDAQRVFAAAVRAARRLASEYVGTEHLLVGMVEAGPTPALEALSRAGIDPSGVRARCESYRLPAGTVHSWPYDPLVLTPYAERALAAAWQEAENDGATGVGAAGLLRVLARDEGGIACEVLGELVGGQRA